MAREGITQAQVFNAADAISAAGQNPTVASIRAKLGTGSFTTITAHLRAWKEQVITSEPEATDVPEEVTTALGRAAEIVWKAANEHFARELTALRKAADDTTLKAYAEADEARAEIERLEEVVESDRETITAQAEHIQGITEQHAALRNIIESLKTERAELRAELKAADARIKEQSDLLRRLVPEAKTGPKAKRTARTTSEPVTDTVTKPLEL